MEIAEFLIIGSGCTGAVAAETLSSTGKKVIMVDMGHLHRDIKNIESDFITIRRTSETQRELFLGPGFESLQEPVHKNLPQQTPQRKFMTELTGGLIPLVSESFFPVESLALGGLGNGWGLGAYTFSAPELEKAGLSSIALSKSYYEVSKMIGISGSHNDDASAYCHGGMVSLQAPTNINPCAESIFNRYKQRKKEINKSGVFLGRPSLALLSEDKHERSAYKYNDLDFYFNEGKSAYRPDITVKRLVAEGKITYLGGLQAIRFIEYENYTELECIDHNRKETVFFKTRRLICAAGTLGTARIVLRSLAPWDKLPIICNAYTYVPFLHWPFLGRRHDGRLSGLAQLAMFYDINRDHSDVAMASVYNYRSLLAFRIAKQMPLNFSDSRKLLKLMLPALGIAGIFHPATYTDGNFIQLQPNNGRLTNDELYASYHYSYADEQKILNTEKKICKTITSLRCLVLKRMRTLTGASIHYSGTLPFNNAEKKLFISPEGRLYGTNSVFVADGSGFKYLPGKGLTLSLMAFAHLVSKKLSDDV